MADPAPYMRDVFIDTVYDAAAADRDVYFISADMGAPALDRFRADLPDQFIHAGISEQNMMVVAAGLTIAGKKVYTYAMAPFVTSRCFEQLKCSIAAMEQPVNVIGIGVGLGYADAGPTHYTTEDIACMRSLPGIEILTAADAEAAASIARLTYEDPAFRFIRLDRSNLPPVYDGRFAGAMAAGSCELAAGRGVCVLASGYALHRALAARDALAADGLEPGVIDVFRIKPLDFEALASLIAGYDAIVTVEEQCLPGGFGSCILEAMSDAGLEKPIRRLGLEERFYFENGGRDYLLDTYGIGVDAICGAVRSLLAH